jgi:hypothetical protein
MKRKMIKAQKAAARKPNGQLGLPFAEPVDEVALWTKAVEAVGIRPQDFGLVVKYARQGHPEARKALDQVYQALEKANAGEVRPSKDGANIGTMGNFGNPARTPGENVRRHKVGEPQPDWPIGREDMKKKGRRRKRKVVSAAEDSAISAGRDSDKIPVAAEKLDVRGVSRAERGWANPGDYARIQQWEAETRRQGASENKANLEAQQRSRQALRQGSKLNEVPR